MAESRDANAEHAHTAAQIEPDVGVGHIANVYAAALLGATEKAGNSADVLAEYQSLVDDVLARQPQFAAVLASGLISHDEKVGIIDRAFGGAMTPMLVNFLKVVSHHGRLDCLGAIYRRARELYDEAQGRVRVRLTTVARPEAAQEDRIAAALRAALGAEPILESVSDPELIGGAVLRIGDTVYDGSIANQLESIRQQMIDRSVHEIQSRRDRFRDPAGD